MKIKSKIQLDVSNESTAREKDVLDPWNATHFPLKEEKKKSDELRAIILISEYREPGSKRKSPTEQIYIDDGAKKVGMQKSEVKGSGLAHFLNRKNADTSY